MIPAGGLLSSKRRAVMAGVRPWSDCDRSARDPDMVRARGPLHSVPKASSKVAAADSAAFANRCMFRASIDELSVVREVNLFILADIRPLTRRNRRNQFDGGDNKI